MIVNFTYCYNSFGMLMDGRHVENDDYRYGFQGQESDDKVKGEGNSYNYKYRMYDPRIGRFFAVDPLAPKYPHYSPYGFSGNHVINSVELEGLEDVEVYNKTPEMEKAKRNRSYTLDGLNHNVNRTDNWDSNGNRTSVDIKDQDGNLIISYSTPDHINALQINRLIENPDRIDDGDNALYFDIYTNISADLSWIAKNRDGGVQEFNFKKDGDNIYTYGANNLQIKNIYSGKGVDGKIFSASIGTGIGKGAMYNVAPFDDLWSIIRNAKTVTYDGTLDIAVSVGHGSYGPVLILTGEVGVNFAPGKLKWVNYASSLVSPISGVGTSNDAPQDWGGFKTGVDATDSMWTILYNLGDPAVDSLKKDESFLKRVDKLGGY